MDAPQALDAAVDLDDRNLRLVQLGGDRLLQLADQPFGRAPLRIDLGAQRLVRLRLEVAERQLFELVLDLAHAEAVGDRRVDVAGLLRDLDAALLGQVVERPHVVEPVGELDEDDPDVVHHRQQHLAEVLRLALLARRRSGMALIFVTPSTTWATSGPKSSWIRSIVVRVSSTTSWSRPAAMATDVQLHVGEEVGHGQRMDQVGLAGMAHLSPVLEGREHVGAPQQLDVGVRAVSPDLFEQILEANHDNRCLTLYRTVRSLT